MHERPKQIAPYSYRMGAAQSQQHTPQKALQFTKADCETGLYAHTLRNDTTMYLKWSSTPAEIRTQMKAYVTKWILNQNPEDESTNEIYIPGYQHIIQKGGFGAPRVSTIYHHAILEVMKEKDFMKRPFILFYNNFAWHIHFVQGGHAPLSA